MLDLANKWRNYERKISEYLLTRERTYLESDCKRRLTERYFSIRSAIDLSGGRSNRGRIAYQHDFRSKIKMPLVREAYNLRKASLRANYRNDPLYSLVPVGNTPRENARNLQDALNYNLKRTQFRRKCLNSLIDITAACGAGVIYSDWMADTRAVWQTVQTPMGPQRMKVPKDRYNVVNRQIHPLNYIQNPNVVDPEESDYQGHYESWPLAKLMNRAKANDDVYINKNVKAVIDEAKESAVKNDSMVHVAKAEDWNALTVDVTIWWAQLQITNNEDDEGFYYVEMVGDKIIRLEEGFYDEELRPYSTFGLDPRPDVWWSNTDPEMQLGFENMLNSVLQMQMDNAIRNLQQFIFLDKALGVDPAMLNRAHQNGGYVFANVKDSNRHVSHLIHRDQGQERNLAGINEALKEAKEGAQRLRPKPDFSRQASEGGIQNKTAYAASLLNEDANIQESDYATAFNAGFIRLGEVNGVILKQMLPDLFAMRPDPRYSQRIVSKEEILGPVDYTVETSMTRNKLQQVMKLQNVITGIQNFKGTSNPVFQALNEGPIVKEWINAMDLPVDAEEVYKEQQQAMPGMVPDANMPGMEQAGAVQPIGAANMGGEPGQVQVGAQLEGVAA